MILDHNIKQVEEDKLLNQEKKLIEDHNSILYHILNHKEKLNLNQNILIDQKIEDHFINILQVINIKLYMKKVELNLLKDKEEI